MEENELKALISLLDDTDQEISLHVEKKIISMGEAVIPHLEAFWGESFDPMIQERIEDIIHKLQYDILKTRLLNWKNTQQDDLLEGMWIIATYQYPDLSKEKLYSELQDLFLEALQDIEKAETPYEKVKSLNYTLYNKFKFGANTKNFHSPANSMLNMVLESKKGNPLSLSVIYLFIAKWMGMPVYGVNLPNLFVLTYKSEDTQFYINTFNKGLIFTKTDVDSYIQQLNLKPQPMFYEPCGNMEILVRTLRNLHVAFDKLGEERRKNEIEELIDILNAKD